MKRPTQSYTQPKTPPKRGKKRGGKRRESIPVIDLSRGPVALTDSYAPDGSDPDDT